MTETTDHLHDRLSEHLADLQQIIQSEIPMCAAMGMEVAECTADGLSMRLPLDPNRNHQHTAFAGSLNAVCTIAGWGTTYLLMRQFDLPGEIVIRRSTIKYHLPVGSREIVARCHVVSEESRAYFAEMVREKGQAKLDLTVEIAGPTRPLVTFSGSYVVVGEGHVATAF